MTRHDWIVLAGVVVSVVFALAVVIFHGGRVNQHLEELQRRNVVLEEKVDSVDRRTSRIEGYLINLSGAQTARPSVEATD